MREQLRLREGKVRPPKTLQKVCCHNGSIDLPLRFRGDCGIETDFVLGRQEGIYCCLQCGYTISADKMLMLYQKYMLDGTPIIVGRNV